MKRRYKITGLTLLILLASISMLFVSANGSNNNSAVGSSVSDTNTADKAIDLDGSKINLKFDNTFPVITPSASIKSEDTISSEKNYDAFVDEAKNIYYFFNGTDILCGFQKEYYYGPYTPINEAIKESDAIVAAETYLKKVIPEFDEYTKIFCQYSEFDAVYQLQYSYHINGIATDDLINVYVQANGDIGAFMMLNRGIYKNMAIEYNSIQKMQDTSAGNFLNQYISKNDEGLVLLRNYESIDETGNATIKQTATLIK